MSLNDTINQILNNFDDIESTRIIEILNSILPLLKSEITREYLGGKIKGIEDTKLEDERKKLCKNLKPYLDWYLQGNY